MRPVVPLAAAALALGCQRPTGVTVEVPEGVGEATVEAADLPHPAPDGLVVLGPVVDIHVEDTDEPVLLSFEIGALPDDVVPVVGHDTGTDWELIAVADWDEDAGIVRAFALDFSIYTVFGIPESGLPDADTIPKTSFDPVIASFGIANDGKSPFSPEGHCIGMAALSRAYGLADQDPEHALSTLWSEQDQRILAARAFKGLDRTWIGAQLALNQVASSRFLGQFADDAVRYLLVARDEPVVIVLQQGERCDATCHAVLAYGYEGEELLVLDSNHPGEERRVRVDGNAASYEPYTRWSPVPSGQITTFDLGELLGDLDPEATTPQIIVRSPTTTSVDPTVELDVDAALRFTDMVVFVDEEPLHRDAWEPASETVSLELTPGKHVLSLLAAGKDDSALSHLELDVGDGCCGNGTIDCGEVWDDGFSCG